MMCDGDGDNGNSDDVDDSGGGIGSDDKYGGGIDGSNDKDNTNNNQLMTFLNAHEGKNLTF